MTPCFDANSGASSRSMADDLFARPPDEPRELPGMRREDRRGFEACQDAGARRDDVEPVGVDDARRLDPGQEPEHEFRGRGVRRETGPEQDGVLALEKGEGAGQRRDRDGLFRCLGQRLGHELGHGPGDGRQDAGGRGHGDQAGPRAQPGPAGQRGRPRLAERAGEDEKMAVAPLVRVPLPPSEIRPDVLLFDQLELQARSVEERRRDADRGDDELADTVRGRRKDMGDLGRAQGDRQIGPDARPDELEAVGRKPGRDVDGRLVSRRSD